MRPTCSPAGWEPPATRELDDSFQGAALALEASGSARGVS